MKKMKINSDELLSAINVLGKVIASKSVMPAYDCIKITHKSEDLVVLRATDGVNEVIKAVYCVNDLVEDIAIGYKALRNVAESNPASTLNFAINDREVRVKTLNGESAMMIADINGVEWYSVPKSYAQDFEQKRAIVDGKSLYSAFGDVAFARASDKSREMLTQIFLDGESEKRVRAVATDGRVITYKSITTTMNEGISLMISDKAMQIIKAMEANTIELYMVNERTGKAVGNGFTLYFDVLEGRYPKYKSVFPIEYPYSCVCSAAALNNAVKRAKVFGNQTSGLCALSFKKDGILTIKSSDMDYAFGFSEDLPCFSNNLTENVAIGVCSLFMLRVLANISGNSVRLEFQDPSRPVLIEGNDEDLKYMLMPMLLEGEPTEQSTEQPTEEEVEDKPWDDEEDIPEEEEDIPEEDDDIPDDEEEPNVDNDEEVII